MPVWFRGGIGAISPDVLSQCYIEPEARETIWIYAPDTEISEHAFLAAENHQGDEIFIVRTVIDGDLVPGMLISRGETTVTSYVHNGRVHSDDEKQILCGTHLRWAKPVNDMIHPRALHGGRLANGTQLYIGMTTIEGQVLIGRIDPMQGRTLFVPVKDKEVSIVAPNYTILISGS